MKNTKKSFKYSHNFSLLRLANNLQDDPGFAMLVDYEKKFRTVLQKVLDEIDVDLTELEKNFLDGRIF